MEPLTKRLLGRGDYIAFEQGCLVITPKSGNPVPDDWLAENLPSLIREIAAATGVVIFQYRRHSVGKFGAHNWSGILLDYTNITTGETAQIFYNCETTRERTTKAGKKGDPLPRGKFRVTERHAFTKYWQSLGLPLPPRLRDFHYCMGKLGGVYVTASQDRLGKIDKSKLKPVTLSADDLKCAFAASTKSSANHPLKTRQSSANYPLSAPAKEMPETQAQQGFQANSSTDEISTSLSNQVSADNPVAITTIDTVIPTHLSDWMAKTEADFQRRQQGKINR